MAVNTLETNGGFGKAKPQAIEKAVGDAVGAAASRWESEQPVPPPIIWRDTLDLIREVSARALQNPIETARRPTEFAPSRGVHRCRSRLILSPRRRLILSPALLMRTSFWPGASFYGADVGCPLPFRDGKFGTGLPHDPKLSGRPDRTVLRGQRPWDPDAGPASALPRR